MNGEYGSRHLLFKTCIAVGFALGIVLLWQTISTYIYVSGNMMTQAAQREAEQKRATLQRAVRPARGGPQENADTTSAMLGAAMSESLEEWKGQVAWLRVVDTDGHAVASAGEPSQEAAGKTFIATFPFGFNRARGVKLEVAIYLDSVSASYAFLRQNLITGISAALALMGALIVLVLRFPKYLRGQQVQGQVALARQVQADLLPAKETVSPPFDFAAECIPAGDVGGDFCDMFPISDNQTAFVLGDVSGKGISAALLMALMHGAIQSTSWIRSAEDHENATRSLNALLCRKTATERFSTLFWGYFDPGTSVLRYVNAGHLPPLLIRSGEFGNLEVQRLETGGPVLGLIPGSNYTQGQIMIRKGDLLVAFSDGIVEASDFRSEEFGENRLIGAIRDGWSDSAGEIRQNVLNRVKDFMSEEHIPDDQTLFVVRFKQAAAVPAVQPVETAQFQMA